MWNKRPRIAEAILRQNKARGFTLSNFKVITTYNKTGLSHAIFILDLSLETKATKVKIDKLDYMQL